ncbi:MAG TPA: hypothetical protein VHC90_16445 [Bryobacteraceae bacterium]|nr:hypothetical protein [Bryobacteraceae bacterium]
MTEVEALIQALNQHQVEYIVVGGVAALAHGSVRLTQDLDLVYRRSPENMDRIVAALHDLKPYLRGAPPGLPFVWDKATLAHGLNFTLETNLGWIDLLGEIPGGGQYEDLVSGSVELQMFSGVSKCLNLDQLIRAKRAAGRPKDLEALAELEALREETGSSRG